MNNWTICTTLYCLENMYFDSNNCSNECLVSNIVYCLNYW